MGKVVQKCLNGPACPHVILAAIGHQLNELLLCNCNAQLHAGGTSRRATGLAFEPDRRLHRFHCIVLQHYILELILDIYSLADKINGMNAKGRHWPRQSWGGGRE